MAPDTLNTTPGISGMPDPVFNVFLLLVISSSFVFRLSVLVTSSGLFFLFLLFDGYIYILLTVLLVINLEYDSVNHMYISIAS